jgi:hypothetical protein
VNVKNAFVGGPGPDLLLGRDGNDRLNTKDGIKGNDSADGGPGTDRCVVDRSDTKSSC